MVIRARSGWISGRSLSAGELDLWAYTQVVELDFSRPGKPTDNAFIEAFNGPFRSEWLNQHWFPTPADASEKAEASRDGYYEVRPHGAIGNVPPAALMTAGGATNPL